MGTHSAAGYLFVYTEMEGVASVAGRPLGSLPSRRADCTCSTALSSGGTVATWKRKQGCVERRERKERRGGEGRQREEENKKEEREIREKREEEEKREEIEQERPVSTYHLWLLSQAGVGPSAGTG